MSGAEPWMKFYPQDWRADEKLRMCSLAARGLWIEMLAIMHRSERYGNLLIGGLVPTDAQLAVQAGASPDEVSALPLELSNAGVFSRTSSGAIYSRRMTRDRKKAETARKNGKKGGNPNLGKQREKVASDNLNPTEGLNSEARSQKPEEAKASSAGDENTSDVVSLMIALHKAAGLAPPDPSTNWAKHSEAVALSASWLKAGADPAMLEQCVAARARTSTSIPKTLKYFDGAVRDALRNKEIVAQQGGDMVSDILARAGKAA